MVERKCVGQPVNHQHGQITDNIAENVEAFFTLCGHRQDISLVKIGINFNFQKLIVYLKWPDPFIVDKPFVFVIRERTTNTILSLVK